MFERFTAAARQAVVDAQQEAARLRHTEIGAEHLLLAVLARDTAGARVLRGFGVDHATVAAAVPARDVVDAHALQSLGIDLDAVRSRVEAAFGQGALAEQPRRGRWRRWPRHIPLTRAAKKALEGSLREAVALGHRSIGTEHLALGLLADEAGPARTLLASAGITPTQAEVRAAVAAEVARG
jgi:ATP-dependent Clp protease ATP-binding subunit ClpA